MDKFFENWKKKPVHEEFIYVSNDKPLKEVLKIAIEIQNNGQNSYLDKDLTVPLIKKFINTLEKIDSKNGRRIFSIDNFKSFRDDVINNYEVLLRVLVLS